MARGVVAHYICEVRCMPSWRWTGVSDSASTWSWVLKNRGHFGEKVNMARFRAPKYTCLADAQPRVLLRAVRWAIPNVYCADTANWNMAVCTVLRRSVVGGCTKCVLQAVVLRGGCRQPERQGGGSEGDAGAAGGASRPRAARRGVCFPAVGAGRTPAIRGAGTPAAQCTHFGNTTGRLAYGIGPEVG